MHSSLFFFAVCVLAATSCTEDDDPYQSCTDTSICGPIATIKLDFPSTLTFPDLEQSSVTVCRNDMCLVGTFGSINAPPSPNTGVGVAIASTPDGGKAAGTSALVMATANGDYWLQVFWPLGLGNAPADGDVYKVTVTNGVGVDIVHQEDTAMTYDISYPYGKDCPTTCSRVVFDHHTS
jgi:hypothetical protein